MEIFGTWVRSLIPIIFIFYLHHRILIANMKFVKVKKKAFKRLYNSLITDKVLWRDYIPLSNPDYTYNKVKFMCLQGLHAAYPKRNKYSSP